MGRKHLIAAFLILYTAAFSSAVDALAQSGSRPAAVSEITQAQMLTGAERILGDSVPAEFGKAFDKMISESGGKVVSGEREVLAWKGNYKSASRVTQSITKQRTNFQAAGWTYEEHGKSGDLEIFTLSKTGAQRRVVLGFFVPGGDVLVCALMEALLPGEKTAAAPRAARNVQASNAPASGAKIVTVDADTLSVNVMGNEMPPVPQFPKLAPKAGRVRGYVKDWTGKPMSGAELGVRSSYLAGYYSGAQGKTDANGYYEFTVPRGMAHFYNAGYQIEWGEGLAAVSLHPADGKLDSFITTDGAVENFVLMPYGVTSRENLQESSHLPATFYGGAIFLSWYGAEADDNNAPAFAVRQGSALEITLRPEGKMFDGSAGQAIVIRKKAGPSGNLRIHNIPLSRYRIAVKANGRSLSMKDNKKYDPLFGMTPVETSGEASILFTPDSVKASMVGPQQGTWKWIDISISTP